jgi:chromosome segregation ATPase
MTKQKSAAASETYIKRPRRFNPDHAAATLKSVYDALDQSKEEVGRLKKCAADLNVQLLVEEGACRTLTMQVNELVKELQGERAKRRTLQGEVEQLRQLRSDNDHWQALFVACEAQLKSCTKDADNKAAEFSELLAAQGEMTAHWREAYEGLKFRKTVAVLGGCVT